MYERDSDGYKPCGSPGRCDREELEYNWGQVWSGEELKKQFKVITFHGPFILVTEKLTAEKGTMTYQDYPRYYFGYRADS